MSINYPLTPPATIAQGIQFAPRTVVAESVSPFTLQQEIFEHQGQMFVVNVKLPPMERAEAEEWAGFFLALNGRLGTFLMGDPTGETPRGTAAGTPLIDGAGQQRSKVLNTKGWDVGATLKAGDYIQLPDNRLHKIMVDNVADGSGLMALDVFPRIRDVLVADDPIITSNTVGIWRIDGDIPAWDIREAQIYGFAFTAREDI